MNNNHGNKGGSSPIRELRRGLCSMVMMVLVITVFLPTDASAVALSRKSRVTPYVEVRETFDDNIFLLPEGAPLRPGQESRDDSIFNLRAGVDLQLDVTRLLTLGFSYQLDRLDYADNQDKDQFINSLELRADIAPRSAEGAQRTFLDRLTLRIRDSLATIPIDTEEALLPGNKTTRNIFEITPTYRIIDTRRTFLDLGYGYQRVDFTEEDVELTTAPVVTNTNQLTSESQTHQGLLNLGYIINPRWTFVTDYTISRKDREEPSPSLVVDPRTRADITRQRLTGGFQFKLSAKTSGIAKLGVEHTDFSPVDVVDPNTGLVQEIEQDSQSGLAANFALITNLSLRSTLTLAYDRFFTENDFGETIETDDLSGRLVFRLGRKTSGGVLVGYRFETRELTQTSLLAPGATVTNDDNTILRFQGGLEYRLGERIRTFGGYEVQNKDFFSELFFDPLRGQREDTTQKFNVGLGYFFTQYFSVNAEYNFVDNDSNFDEEDYTVNRFSLFGRAAF